MCKKRERKRTEVAAAEMNLPVLASALAVLAIELRVLRVEVAEDGACWMALRIRRIQ